MRTLTLLALIGDVQLGLPAFEIHLHLIRLPGMHDSRNISMPRLMRKGA